MLVSDASYCTGTGADSWLSQDLSQAMYQSKVQMSTLQEMIEQGASQQEIHLQRQIAYNLSQRVNELYAIMHEQHGGIASGRENGYQYNPQVRYSQRIY